MTVQEISKAFGVPAADIFGYFGKPATSDPKGQIKSYADEGAGKTVDGLREWLKTRK